MFECPFPWTSSYQRCPCLQDLISKLCSNQNVPVDDDMIASTVAPLRSTRMRKSSKPKAKKPMPQRQEPAPASTKVGI